MFKTTTLVSYIFFQAVVIGLSYITNVSTDVFYFVMKKKHRNLPSVSRGCFIWSDSWVSLTMIFAVPLSARAWVVEKLAEIAE